MRETLIVKQAEQQPHGGCQWGPQKPVQMQLSAVNCICKKPRFFGCILLPFCTGPPLCSSLCSSVCIACVFLEVQLLAVKGCDSASSRDISAGSGILPAKLADTGMTSCLLRSHLLSGCAGNPTGSATWCCARVACT